jgi:hypothetical protein
MKNQFNNFEIGLIFKEIIFSFVWYISRSGLQYSWIYGNFKLFYVFDHISVWLKGELLGFVILHEIYQAMSAPVCILGAWYHESVSKFNTRLILVADPYFRPRPGQGRAGANHEADGRQQRWHDQLLGYLASSRRSSLPSCGNVQRDEAKPAR